MANVSFAGYEAVVQIAGATVAVAEMAKGTVKQTLEKVPALGDFKPQDYKEVFQECAWELKRAYFADATAADFFTKATRDANGYLTAFTMLVTITDKSGGGAGVAHTYTLANCKVEEYSIELPAGKGYLVENLKGPCLTITRV